MTTRSTRIIRFVIELDSLYLLDYSGNLIGITCVTSSCHATEFKFRLHFVSLFSNLGNDREDAAYMNIIRLPKIELMTFIST
jgi:hypothetical protein